MDEIIEAKFVGTRIMLRATFTRADSSTATDPVSVWWKIRKPGGALSTLAFGVDAAIIKTSTGVYELRYTLDTPGRWWFGAEAGGAGSDVVAVEEVQVIAKRRATVVV